MKNLQSFAENNKETQGKFTIADEKVGPAELSSHKLWITTDRTVQKHNVFMRVDVSSNFSRKYGTVRWLYEKDPVIQKATGKTDPVEVMAKLREMKNNFKWVSITFSDHPRWFADVCLRPVEAKM